MKPEKIFADITGAIKAEESLNGVVCKYAYSMDFSSNPICNFTLCLSLGKSEYENDNSLISKQLTEVKLCLLAPNGAGGKALSQTAYKIAQTLKASLSVKSVKIGEVKHNEVNNTLYTDISVTVCESYIEESDFGVRISGVPLDNVHTLKVQSEELFEEVGQLLNGKTLRKKEKEEYTLSLKLTGELFRNESGFSLEICHKEGIEAYGDCKIISIDRELSSEGVLLFGYKLKSCERKVYKNEV